MQSHDDDPEGSPPEAAQSGPVISGSVGTAKVSPSARSLLDILLSSDAGGLLLIAKPHGRDDWQAQKPRRAARRPKAKNP